MSRPLRGGLSHLSTEGGTTIAAACAEHVGSVFLFVYSAAPKRARSVLFVKGSVPRVESLRGHYWPGKSVLVLADLGKSLVTSWEVE